MKGDDEKERVWDDKIADKEEEEQQKEEMKQKPHL